MSCIIGTSKLVPLMNPGIGIEGASVNGGSMPELSLRSELLLFSLSKNSDEDLTDEATAL